MTESEKFPSRRVRSENSPLVISVDNAPNTCTYNFVYTLTKNDWDYEIIAIGKPWAGFKSKIQYFHEHLKNVNPERLLVLSDARDVFCVRSPQHFEQAFREFNKPMLVSLEIFCQGYPDDRIVLDPKNIFQCVPLNEYWKHQTIQPTHRKFVNSGLIAGKAKDLLTYFSWVVESGWTDDQASLGDYMNKFPDRVAADVYANVLHTSTFGVSRAGASKKQWEDSPSLAEICGRKGFFLHLPGINNKTGQYQVYKLIEKLIMEFKITSAWFGEDALRYFNWDRGCFDEPENVKKNE